MARKRASLKDKGMEVLRPTKKSRGIDILFGESADKEETTESSEAGLKTTNLNPAGEVEVEEENMPVNESDTVPAPSDPVASLPPSLEANAPGSLPVNEADIGTPDIVASEIVVDELGLPVALEAPPADLVMAVPEEEFSLPADVITPAVPPPLNLPPAADRPTATVEMGASPPVTEVFPAELEDEADLSGLAAEVAGDLSGLAAEEDDLSGLALDEVAAPSLGTIPPANLPPGAPSVQSAPANPVLTPGPVVQPVPEPVAVSPSPAPFFVEQPAPPLPEAPAVSLQPEPARPSAWSTAPFPTPSPSPNLPSFSSEPQGPVSFTPAAPTPVRSPDPTARAATMPQARVASIGGIVTERIQVLPENILPEDIKAEEDVNNIINIRPIEEEDEDERLTNSVIRFVGRERREKLDREIELLYERVAIELSSNKTDTEFALETLRKAQDLVFEDPRQYDEALYLVATVRTMLARKRNLGRWSYTWGLFVFFYAVVWLLVFIAGFLLNDQMSAVFVSTNSPDVKTILAAWFSALAGGIGGVLSILYSLHWRVSTTRDFDPQFIMYYLVQPIMGFVLGAVVYFIVAAGFLFVNLATNTGDVKSGDVLASTTVIAFQVLFGLIAGFRQKFVFETIDRIVQQFSAKPDDTGGEKSTMTLAPTDQAVVVTAKPDETTTEIVRVKPVK